MTIQVKELDGQAANETRKDSATTRNIKENETRTAVTIQVQEHDGQADDETRKDSATSRNIKENETSRTAVIKRLAMLPNMVGNTNGDMAVNRIRLNAANANKNRTVLKSQRHVLAAIGVIWLSVNMDIFMTPMVFLAAYENLQFGEVSRGLKYICLTMAMLNSALSPVINISMIKPFQHGLRDKAMQILQLFGIK